MHVAAGEGGIVFVTNSSTLYYLNTTATNGGTPSFEKYTLGPENFTQYQIDRVEVNGLPIFYLKNGSTVVLTAGR